MNRKKRHSFTPGKSRQNRGISTINLWLFARRSMQERQEYFALAAQRRQKASKPEDKAKLFLAETKRARRIERQARGFV